MMNHTIDTMKDLLMELLPSDMKRQTSVNGVNLVRRETPYEAVPLIYKPEIILMAQGTKNVYLGDKIYTYDKNNYFVVTVPLPVICEAIIKPGEPLLGIVIEIDPKIIGEIITDMNTAPPNRDQISNSLFQAEMSEEIIDAAVRLLKAIKTKDDTEILGPLYVKEIIFKVLRGEHGEFLKELAYNNRNLYQISRVINIINENFSDPLEMQTLAKEAGMSVSAFNNNFRAVTSTSPLQYIKNIRLHRAKELIQIEGEKAYSAASRVGYESSSQFSREYKRLFGITPARDKLDVTASV